MALNCIFVCICKNLTSLLLSHSPIPAWPIASSASGCWEFPPERVADLNLRVFLHKTRHGTHSNLGSATAVAQEVKDDVKDEGLTSASWLRGSKISFSICTSCCISSEANRFSASPQTSIIFLQTCSHTRKKNIRHIVHHILMILCFQGNFISISHRAFRLGQYCSLYESYTELGWEQVDCDSSLK